MAARRSDPSGPTAVPFFPAWGVWGAEPPQQNLVCLLDFFGRFRTVFGRFRIVFGPFRTVFGPFRIVSDRFRTVSDRFGPFLDRFGSFRIGFGSFIFVIAIARFG